jgi:transcriptional regulator with XRE-family HTH domain
MKYDSGPLKKIMLNRNVSSYALAKKFGVPQQTMSNYCNGKSKPPSELCLIIADELNVAVFDIFPEMLAEAPELADISANPDYEPRTQLDSKTQNGKDAVMEIKTKIGLEHMLEGNSNIVPDNGVHVKSRLILTQDNEQFQNLVINQNEQFRILTGISSRNLNVSRIQVKTNPELMTKHEFRLDSFLHVNRGEVMLFGYVHGEKMNVYRGLIVGELMFL